MHIDELVNLVPPPMNPVHSTGDWVAIVSDLGIDLPSDYKQFIERYGEGVLCSYFDFESPFAFESPRSRLRTLVRYYESWAERGREIPYSLYPESPGLLPFCSYGDVDMIAWYTKGEPDSWSIVYHDREEGCFPVEMGFLQFLLSVLNGRSPLPKSVIGDEILSVPYVFRTSD